MGVIPGVSSSPKLEGLEAFMEIFGQGREGLDKAIADFKGVYEKAKAEKLASEKAKADAESAQAALRTKEAEITAREADIAKRETKVATDIQTVDTRTVNLKSDQDAFKQARVDQDAYYHELEAKLKSDHAQLAEVRTLADKDAADRVAFLDKRQSELGKREEGIAAKEQKLADAQAIVDAKIAKFQEIAA